MAEYTIDRIEYSGNVYKLQDSVSGYLPLTGGQVTGPVSFGDSISVDEATIGDLVVNGSASFTNNIQANTINGVTVGASPKFTDTITTATTTGSGNAVTAITASNGALTATKGSTFLTSHQSVTNKNATLAWSTTSTIATIGSTDIKITMPANPNTNTTYSLSDALSSHKFTTTLTPSSGNATTSNLTLAAGSNISLTDDTTNKKITIAATDTKYSAGTGLSLSSNTFSNYRGIEYIRGTWTAASGTWTGVSTDSALYDGKQIILYMPFGGSGNATLNLTLAGGGTTGAKNVYFESTTRFTTHKGQNSQLHLIYHESLVLSDGNTYSGWWYVANRDTNNNDSSTGYTRFSHGTYTTTTAVGRYVICLTKSPTSVVPVTAVNNSTATTKTLTTDTFNPFEPIFYYTNNGSTTQTAANAALSVSYLWRNYSNINLGYSFNTGTTLTNNKDVYIKATPTSGYMATLASTPIVQSLPTSDDGFIYIKLGHACSTSNIAMSYEHPIYWYKNGAVRLYGGDAATVNGLTMKLGYTTSGNNRAVQADSNGNLYVTQKDDNTTYSSKAAASGGTDVSLVTTGEKYTWNNKQDKLTNPVTGTGTSGYLAKWNGSGSITSGPQIGSGTTKFLREDGTWQTPSYIANTDAKLQVAEVTSGTQYYPLVGTGTSAATRQYDTTGFKYKGTKGTTSAVGSSILELGNSTASGTANNKQGKLVIYGSTAYAHTIQGAPSAARTLTLPNATGTIALTSQIYKVAQNHTSDDDTFEILFANVSGQLGTGGIENEETRRNEGLMYNPSTYSLYLGVDTNAASGTDYEINTALTDLGWADCLVTL